MARLLRSLASKNETSVASAPISPRKDCRGGSEAMPYKPIIPADAPQLTVDVNDWRYKAAHDFAERSGWTQEQFSKALGNEARRVAASAPKPAPAPAAPAAARPAVPENWDKLSAREQFAHGLAHGSTRSNRGG
jgi:hypothetical protein